MSKDFGKTTMHEIHTMSKEDLGRLTEEVHQAREQQQSPQSPQPQQSQPPKGGGK